MTNKYELRKYIEEKKKKARVWGKNKNGEEILEHHVIENESIKPRKILVTYDLKTETWIDEQYYFDSIITAFYYGS